MAADRQPVPSHEALEAARKRLREQRARCEREAQPDPAHPHRPERWELALVSAALLLVLTVPWALVYEAVTGRAPGSTLVGLLPIVGLAVAVTVVLVVVVVRWCRGRAGRC